MVQTASLIPFPCEYILPVASTIDRVRLQEFVKGWITFRSTATAAPLPYIHLVPDAREALFHAHASVVASGTATVQAAVIGNPFVVVYRVSALTFALARQLVKYPAEIPVEPDVYGNLPIAMVNLIAGRRIVPELLQDQFTPENLAAKLLLLLADTPERSRMISDLADLRAELLPDPTTQPIKRAAEIVAGLLQD
jgi:lipid-A-disaccharide synthase